MDKCAVFVAYYRGLDRYYNFIFSGRKISREEHFAGGKFREIPFAGSIIFAGGKFRAKSKFANIAKISSTRKIGVIGLQYRLSMSKNPCHTIFFSFRVVGPQSWVLRVTKLSRFRRYPQDKSPSLLLSSTNEYL